MVAIFYGAVIGILMLIAIFYTSELIEHFIVTQRNQMIVGAATSFFVFVPLALFTCFVMHEVGMF